MKKYLFPILLFTSAFLFFYFVIDTRLIFQAQQPPFLTGLDFFADFAAYPGGLTWYASAFLTQFYVFPVCGALLLALIIALVYWQTAAFTKAINGRILPEILIALPAINFIVVSADYMLPLTYAIRLVIVLAFFTFYKNKATNKTTIRLLVYIILVIAAYYLTSMGAVLFALLCTMDELLIRKKITTGIVMLFVIAAIPFVAASWFFVMLVPAAYYDIFGIKTFLLNAAVYPKTPFFIYGIYAYFVIMILVLLTKSKVGGKTQSKRKSAFTSLYFKAVNFIKSKYGFAAQIFVAVAILIFAINLLFDKKVKENYQIEYFAQNRMWFQIEQAITPANAVEYSLLSQTQLFRAMFYEGNLLSDLFTYPQGMPGLSFEMTTGNMATHYPLLMADCSFDAGALNMAEYWANQAMSMQGKKTVILQRLVLIHVLKGEKESAAKLNALLSKTLFSKKTVLANYRLLSNDSLLFADDYLRQVRMSAPKYEYMSWDFIPDLANLIHANNKNKMALEFLMMHNLLNNGVSPVLENLTFFSDAGYTVLPRYIQEALVFQLALTSSTATSVGGYQIDKNYFSEFNSFSQAMSQFGNNKPDALRSTYAQFGTTYWFYVASNGKPLYLKK